MQQHARGLPTPAGPVVPDPTAPASAPIGPAARPVGPLSAGPTVVARRNRAEERLARRRAARMKWLVAVAVALAVVVLAGGGWWLLVGRDTGSGGSQAGDHPRQQTLLVQVVGADRTALASALLGVQPDSREAVSTLVPSRLIVEVAGSGSVPFGETSALPGAGASAAALTDLLGVRVDGSWTLSTKGLAALVDRLGGVDAAVDVDVVTKDAAGRETIVARAGQQHLGGAAAAAYATYSTPGEPEQARLARFNVVLDAVLRGLPADSAQVHTALGALGTESRSTGREAGDLPAVLAAVHAAAAADGFAPDVLPVTEIDTGAAEQAYGIDALQASTLVRTRFAGALQGDGTGGGVRVLVQNGVGTPGLVDKARTRLVDAGLRFVNGGNAAQFGRTTTVVLIPDGSDESLQRGKRVAKTLGVPAGAVEISNQGQTVAEVIVILGRDFKP
ncbi:MAG TPA: LytR C-terminal domain-containing protein [Actinomycetes bacterium]